MLNYGRICGGFNIKMECMRCFLICVVFLILSACQTSDLPERLVFNVYSLDENEWLGVDTLCIPVVKSKDRFRHFRMKDYLLISDIGIEEINQKKIENSLLFSFQDTSQFFPGDVNTCIPFISSDSKLVARKFMSSNYEIYKYRTDYYAPSAHDIKFVYTNPNDGILLWIDYFGNRSYVNSSYECILKELREDSTLYEFPKYMPAPRMLDNDEALNVDFP